MFRLMRHQFLSPDHGKHMATSTFGIEQIESSVSNQLVPRRSKRSVPDGEKAEPGEKKAKMEGVHALDQWKCTIKPCSERRFATIQDLRSHIKYVHTARKFLCDRCPFSTADQGSLFRHECRHIHNESKCNGTEEVQKCTLCNVYFVRNGVKLHNKMYH